MVLKNLRSYAMGKSNNSNVYYVDMSGTNQSASNFGTLPSECLVALGTGTTEATESDHALANDVTTSFAIVGSVTRVISNVNQQSKFEITETLKNNTSASITITEYGLYHAGKSCLLTREVLTSPITVEAGGNITISAVLG